MRYYSTQRPITPGAYPVRAEVTEIRNFESRTYCDEIGAKAWGYLEMVGSLTESEKESYELVEAGKLWYCVTTSFDDKGTVRACITSTIRAAVKPESKFIPTGRHDFYYDYYGSREEAVKAVEEAKKA